MQAPTAAMANMLRTPTQIIENTYNLYCNPQGKRRLPNDFVPGMYDVICARGKKAHDSEGNVRFRQMVEQHQEEYANCTCKYEKSKIVSYIVNTIRQACSYHQGGFVKNVDGLWYEVGDRAAKEKIGQTFRDLLHTKYSSSTKAKAKARIQKRVEEHQLDEELVPTTTESHDKAPKRKSSFMTLKIPGLGKKFPSFTKTINGNSNNSNNNNNDGSTGNTQRNRNKSIVNSSLTMFNPDTPISEENVLEQLRSSVQTVDCNEYYDNPSAQFQLSNSTLNMGEDDWMKLSTTSTSNQSRRMSALGGVGGRRPSTIAMSTTSIPEELEGIFDEDEIEGIVDAYMGSGDPATPYGIFSSSTKSNPFSASVIENSPPRLGPNTNRRGSLLNSMTSLGDHNNPLLKSSTNSSFMDMDLSGLLMDMGSMSMLEAVNEKEVDVL